MLFFMLDWFTGLVGYDGSHLDTGKTLLLNPGGEIYSVFDRWLKAMGSYEQSIQIKPDVPTPDMLTRLREQNELYFRPYPDPEHPGKLYTPSPRPLPSVVFKLQGNPSKFIQGHNVFGPSVSALGPAINKVIRSLPSSFNKPELMFSWLGSEPVLHRMRVDVTTSIRMDNDAMVHEFIQHAQQEMRSRHRKQHRSQSGLAGATTVSFGTGSARWMIVIYCKLCELLAHPAADPDMQAALLDYAQGLLRIELRLFRLTLADIGDRVPLSESLIWTYYDKIEVGVMKNDADKQALNLRPRVRQIYQLWLDGHIVTPVAGFYKRATFYQYRKEILEVTGQDISLDYRAGQGSSNVSREVFNSDYLKAHEETEIPEHLQKYLYSPPGSKVV